MLQCPLVRCLLTHLTNRTSPTYFRSVFIMAQFKPKQWDIIQCVDIFSEIKEAQWLVQSMKDAISSHWKEPELIEHISYLVDNYYDKMESLIPKLDKAFEKVSPNPDVDEWLNIFKQKDKE